MLGKNKSLVQKLFNNKLFESFFSKTHNFIYWPVISHRLMDKADFPYDRHLTDQEGKVRNISLSVCYKNYTEFQKIRTKLILQILFGFNRFFFS